MALYTSTEGVLIDSYHTRPSVHICTLCGTWFSALHFLSRFHSMSKMILLKFLLSSPCDLACMQINLDVMSHHHQSAIGMGNHPQAAVKGGMRSLRVPENRSLQEQKTSELYSILLMDGNDLLLYLYTYCTPQRLCLIEINLVFPQASYDACSSSIVRSSMSILYL